MKKNALVLILLSILSSPSFSGVQSVGKGGGFAEMQAYAIDRSLPQLLSHCLKPQNYCGLNSRETEISDKLSQSLKSPDVSLIQINESCEHPYFHPSVGSASIDACRLYSQTASDLGPLPLSHDEIAEVVLKARLLSLDPDISETFTSALTRKLTLSFQFEDRQVLVPVKGYYFRLHIWSLSTAGTNSQSLTIETLKQSHDLTEKLHSFLCPAQIRDLNFSEFQFFDSSLGSTGKSQITWACGTRRYQADLYVDLSFQDENLKDVSLSLFQKKEI